ncbi:elongation factor Ts [Patescibacteria group bacterium]|nr:elongation factor Ts [Patescibacteria group bacterium]MBU4142175.1 elongation factor Ts [Patescibacteria group bacterium]MBU4339168.1 elongation factor Ts [Patescibacteria group bacterium]MBU4580480.1 elongation factor Ts [Patescibacteria group bacterium]
MEDAQKIKELRMETGASILDCRNTLVMVKGDMEKAKKILAEKRKSKIEKKSGRETGEGAIASYIHSNKKIGVLVEISCETDFVAKNESFLQLAHDIAMHIAASNPLCVDTPESHPEIAKMIEDERKKAMEEFSGKKPKEMIENIVAGKIKKFADNITLVKQAYIKDPKKTIGDLVGEAIVKLGENVKIKRFCKFQID